MPNDYEFTPDFLKFLFPSIPPGLYLAIWDKPEGKTHYFSDAAKAFDFAREKTDVFYHVALQRRKRKTRGNRESAGAITCFWLDVDLASRYNQGRPYPTDFDHAWKLINEAYSHKPSLVVHSGLGYHVYWLFDRPVCIGELETQLDVTGAGLKAFTQTPLGILPACYAFPEHITVRIISDMK